MSISHGRVNRMTNAEYAAYQREAIARVNAEFGIEPFSPPADVNVRAKFDDSSSGRSVGGVPRLANLDFAGRLVSKGCRVSYGGVRGDVVRVSRGKCCVSYLDYLGRCTGSVEWLRCESLQVVA